MTAPALFRGEWLEPGHPEYESARPAFNRRDDARPAVIARCLGVSDVVAAVAHARERGLRINVRSTGFSVGRLTAGDEMLIDLGLMRAIHVFPESRTARIQGGARGGDLQLEAAVHGLGAATGGLSGTGVGLILDAGMGHLSPRVGYATDNVLSLELVTAAGEVVVASPDENPDLFWATRGASGNFGVVTALEVRLHEVPPLVHAGAMTWSLEKLERGIEVLRASWEWSDALSILSFVGTTSLGAPGLETIVCHSGPADAALSDLQRLRELGAPDGDSVVPIRFADQHFVVDDWFPPMRSATDQQPVEDLSDELVEALVASINEPAGEGSRLVEIIPLRGGLGRAPEFPSAFRTTAHPPTWCLIPGCWYENPSEDQMHDEWVRDVMETIQRIGPAVDRRDPSCVGVALDAEALARMYGDGFGRLRELKRHWDPENVFVGNHDVQPAGI